MQARQMETSLSGAIDEMEARIDSAQQPPGEHITLQFCGPTPGVY